MPSSSVSASARPRLVPDVVLTLLIVALVVGGGRMAPVAERPSTAGVAIGVAGAASLLLWRRWPVLTAGLCALAEFGYLVLGNPGGPAMIVGPVSMLAVGYRASRGVAVASATGMSAAVAVGSVLGGGDLWLAAPAWTFALVFAGQLLAARVERQAAQRERDRLVRRHVAAGERLRIAQDLHDSVAHSLATISVQSGVAAHLLAKDGHPAAASLDAIRSAAADALDELGAILTALRDPEDAVPVVPAAGLSRIGDLIAGARADGLRVDLTETGDPSAVSGAVSAAGYRVVQEALSNARRHAGTGAAVDVEITAGQDGALRIAVEDDGGEPGRRSGSGTGLGLVGMRERVTATGGRFDAGPRFGRRGFAVVAVWERPASYR